jgi:tetratricopeptide (TPR) repeat protein
MHAAGWPVWLALTCIVLAGTAAYARGLSGPFLFDDELSIERNEELRQWPDLGRVLRSAPPESPLAGRPLVSLAFAANSAWFGRDVRSYRTVNLAMHIACALLLFGIVRRTATASPDSASTADIVAFGAAMIWVVHPLNSETVLYVTQRTEGMMALMAMATVYASIRGREGAHPGRWQAVSVAACALGMMCKETMVTVPVLVALYDRVFTFTSFAPAFRERGRFYAALAACWLVLGATMWSAPRTIGSGFNSSFASPWDYLLQQTVMITRYLRLAVWPDALVLYYGWATPTTLAAVWPYAIFVVALALATIGAFAWRPAIGFLGAWFFITLSPTSSLVPIASEVGAERRMYLPLAALAILVVVAIVRVSARVVQRRPALVVGRTGLRSAGVVLAAIVALLGSRTHSRTRDYASPLLMAQTVHARWPTAASAHMLGTELVEAGRPADAIAYLREAAATLAPARLDLGVQLFKTGQYRDAVDQLRAFVRDEPHLTAAQTADLVIAQALTLDGRADEAVAHLTDVRARRPDEPVTIGLLADAQFSRGDFVNAIENYRAFLARIRDQPDALANLAIAYVNTGRLDDAVDTFRRLAQMQPANVHANLNLTRALLDRGRADDVAEASDRAEALVKALPQEPAVHSLAGLAFERQRRPLEARTAYARALALDPTHAPALDGLARLGR